MSSKSKMKGKIPSKANKPVIAGGTVTKPKIPAPTPAVSPPPAKTSIPAPTPAVSPPPAKTSGELAELEKELPVELAELSYHDRKAAFQEELADLLEKWGFTREAFRTRNTSPSRANR
jgi:hypothetical protein